jgi:DNA-binding protein HU-beta
MTKAELIESVASKVDLPRATAERAVNTMFDEIVAALKQGDKVNISGFGTFSISTRKARTGRNPKTGESIEIAASRAAKFKPGKTLKDEINEGSK